MRPGTYRLSFCSGGYPSSTDRLCTYIELSWGCKGPHYDACTLHSMRGVMAKENLKAKFYWGNVGYQGSGVAFYLLSCGGLQ